MLKRLLLGVAGTILAFSYGFLLGSVINVYASGFGGGGGASWPLLAPSGSAGAPSYAFTTYPTDGLYDANQNIRIALNGTYYFGLRSSAYGGNGTILVPNGSSTVPGLTDTSQGLGGVTWGVSTNSFSVLNNSLETVRWDATGRQYFKRQTSVPTMGACGTSPSVAVGADNSMTVTVGTGGSATACVINFGANYLTNPPNCSVVNDTDKVAYSTVEAVGSLTINAAAAFTASSKFKVNCIGVL